MGEKFSKKFYLGAGSITALVIAAIIGIAIGTNDDKKAKAGNTTLNNNGTMMQGFEWYLDADGTHWANLESKASELANAGITSLWLPPAYKGANGGNDVGYGVYDLYDLGEFEQKGSVRTKYGTKEEYLSLIDTLHDNGIQVYADIVLNHKGGADAKANVSACKVNSWSRGTDASSAYTIGAWCVFNFPGRNGQYSTFTWDASCFDGVDWDDNNAESAVFRFADKGWDWQVDTENGNYDYLMYADIDFDNSNVVNELTNWGTWYVNTADLDGFRLDAVKHIKFDFYKTWLTDVRNNTGKELFSVGEYWTQDLGRLTNYLNVTNGTTSLFDVPLHYNFESAANSSGGYDMRYLFNNTLVNTSPTLAVTFVENHDSQPGQSLQSTVAPWFKPLAYTAILTREGGYPCVFYGDYYGTNDGQISSSKAVLDKILAARKDYAYGTQHDYLNDANVIGWTREGDSEHANSGLAALITDGAGGSKSMYVGISHAGEQWIDITGNKSETVTIGSNGYGTFSVNGGSHSIWVPGTENDDDDDDDDNVDPIAKIFYYNANGWSNPYIHYCVDGSTWTTAPGVKMNTTSSSSYYYYEIDLGSASKVTTCYNNGSGSWDSNNGSNYVIKKGIYTVKNGNISSGAPNGVTVATVTAEPTTEPTVTPTETPTAEPTAEPTVAPTETPSGNEVTVYYYNSSSWSNVNIHYCPTGGSWTTVPGMAMTSYGNGYYSYTIDLGTATGATVCFNNGSNWDSNNGANYTVGTGVYTIKNGSVTATEPEGGSNTTTNEVTVYYYNSSSWSNVYIHYCPNEGSWTSVPGVKMTKYSGNYYSYTIDLGSATGATVCFNNGSGSWDSNNGSNYTVGTGSYTINNGTVTATAP